MRVVIGALLLTLAVFFNFIELSVQNFPEKAEQSEKRPLPEPFYYNDKGQIRERGRPEAVPIIKKGEFIGMKDRGTFYGIKNENNHAYVIRLQDNALLPRTQAQIYHLAHSYLSNK